jgi:tRNA (guanine37-N1)-methyltransferase
VRIDVLTIFPDYLRPLELSLAGRARESGLLDLAVHDLRDWTHDRHRTVDDTPYGGGAGMVMKPEPWGEALDAVVSTGSPAEGPATLVVPTPAGERFHQRLAAELAAQPHLVFACGRYEGIDQRVLDDARGRMRVREVSLGDYVLNGGEVAALAMIEAVARLVPGFLGNAASLSEESHGEDGLLEYPVYTKPPSWRGHQVPEVLLSGDHGRIAAWRHEQSLRRTAERRPDLAPPSSVGEIGVRAVQPSDAGELLTLQRACWVQEQQANPGLEIDALTEGYDDVRAWIRDGTVLVAHVAGRLVGAVRGRQHEPPENTVWDIGRLMVAPDCQGRGLGRMLLERIEAAAPPEVSDFELFTGAGSTRNQKMYRKAGYRLRGEVRPRVVRLTKRR